MIRNLSAEDTDIAARSVLVGDFGVGDHTDRMVRVFLANGTVQERTIVANSETVLLLDAPWDVGNVPDATSDYEIFQPEVAIEGDISSSYTNFRRIFYRLPFFSFFRFLSP